MSQKLYIVTTKFNLPIVKLGTDERKYFQKDQRGQFELANNPNMQFWVNFTWNDRYIANCVTIQLIWFEYNNQKIFEKSVLNHTFILPKMCESSNGNIIKFPITGQELLCLLYLEKEEYSVTLGCEVKDVNILQSPYANCKIRQKLWAQYTAKFGDVVLANSESKFMVSSYILSIQSEVFEKMLQSGMKEQQSKVIEINDVSSELMEVFIHWLYLGEIVNPIFAEELFLLGDRYMIDELKIDCVDHIIQTLDSNNVSKWFSIAVKYNCKPLAHFVNEFVKEYDQNAKLGTFLPSVWDHLAIENQH